MTRWCAVPTTALLACAVIASLACGASYSEKRARVYIREGDARFASNDASKGLAFHRKALSAYSVDWVQAACRSAAERYLDHRLGLLASAAKNTADDAFVAGSLRWIRRDAAEKRTCSFDLSKHEERIRSILEPVWTRAWAKAQEHIANGHYTPAVRLLAGVATATPTDSVERQVLRQIQDAAVAYHADLAQKAGEGPAASFHQHIAAQLGAERPFAADMETYQDALRAMGPSHMKSGLLTGDSCGKHRADIQLALDSGKASAQVDEDGWAAFQDRVDLHIKRCQVGQTSSTNQRMAIVHEQEPYTTTETDTVSGVRTESFACQRPVCLSGSDWGSCTSKANISAKCHRETPYSKTVTRTVTRYKVIQKTVPVTETTFAGRFYVELEANFSSKDLGYRTIAGTAEGSGESSDDARAAQESLDRRFANAVLSEFSRVTKERFAQAAEVLAQKAREGLHSEELSLETENLLVVLANARIQALDSRAYLSYFGRHYGLESDDIELLLRAEEPKGSSDAVFDLPEVDAEVD